MGVTVVDPPREPGAANTQLIFQTASMTNTKLYAPGSDASTPEYFVAASKDVKTVTLTRVRAGGQQAPVATVTYASALARGRGKLGQVGFAGRDVKVPIEEWLSIKKAKIERDKAVELNIQGQQYSWTVGVQSGARGICTLTRGGAPIAMYVPSRSSAPEGFQMRSSDMDGHFKTPENRSITRAYLDFAVPPAEEEAIRDEVLLSLLIFQHLHRIMGGTSQKGYSWGCMPQ